MYFQERGKEKFFLNYKLELELRYHFPVFVGKKEKKKFSLIIISNSNYVDTFLYSWEKRKTKSLPQIYPIVHKLKYKSSLIDNFCLD